jgi:alcohol dehydrogenase (cytochrome c)
MIRDSGALSASCIGLLLALNCMSNTAVAVSSSGADGKALYVSQGCAGCHGAGGQGGMGKRLATNTALGDTDAMLHRIVFGGKGMPPFGDTLSDEQVVSVADFLRTNFGNDFGSIQKARVDAVRKAGPAGMGSQNADDTNGMIKPGGIAVGAPSLAVQMPTSDAPSQKELDSSAESVESWLMFNKSYDGQRYSSLTQINAKNAARLEVQCVAQLGIQTSFNAMPLVYAGVMYVTAANRTFAFDARNCRQLWQHVYTAKDLVQYDANRGVAIYEGRLFRGTSDAHVIALDVKTGTLLWDVRPVDSAIGYFFSAAPIAWNDTLFLGTAGADWGAPGLLFALNVKDGTTRWSLSEIDEATFGGSSGATGGGGSWSSFTLDTENGKLYVPVGNPAPDFDARHRPGKNLYTDSVIVVDAKTGALNHYYQQVPKDSHDYDTAATPVIFHLPRNAVRSGATRYRKTGTPENIDFAKDPGERAETPAPSSSAQPGPSDLFMAVGSKEGHVSLYNDTRQELMYRVPVTSIEAPRQQPTGAGVHTCPGTVGGVEWYGPAFDPIYRRMYVGAVDWCAKYTVNEARYVRGQIYMGGTFEFDPVEKSRGWITSIDAGTGRLLWKYQSELPIVASVTPTAGDVLFTGELTGNFLVLDKSSGQKLYSFYTGGPVAGGIATYTVDGHQYVAVPSGNMSRSFSMDLSPSATVFLFALREPQTGNH